MSSRRRVVLVAMALLAAAVCAADAWAIERFPPPDFYSGHQLPELDQRPLRLPPWMDRVHVAALATGLALSTWFSLRLRSRTAIRWLAVASLVYFGFYLGGCVCPIGSIQNVTLALADADYTLPVSVVFIFALPVVFALLFGRVFCSGVCPLGAIQDLVLIRPLRVPLWLQSVLGLVPFVYLGAAILMAATDSFFIVCRWDPFVGFFRLDGNLPVMILGGVLLIVSTFVGRPYCRFLCPYGALLGLCSRVAWKHVTITPDECVNCRLCEDACPFGAIRPATTEEDA
ncbi:MAG: 4Fe-4S binding protein [Phycisphaerae bacterium]|nr:4Fe-4S binding protein [Phycisphaerae bacterium]